MKREDINKLFEKKNITELLSYTLIGLSLIKDKYKEYENDYGCYGYKQLEGVNNAEKLATKYLCELIN